ncbi:MAG TPA: hypothetical protein VES65_04555 [Solirubrobacteraceae bacterium]|nr:hypothetical protein [Solirubrobacteraceae bacterium]
MLAAELLRPGLLDGVSVLVAHAPPPDGDEPAESFAQAARASCAELGARVRALACGPVVDEALTNAAVTFAVAELGGRLDMLVVDGPGLFARGSLTAARTPGDRAAAALRACLDVAWDATRAAVNRAFLPAGHGGRIVYLAPGPDAGEHADAARAGLENLARTLSIEWARHSITTATVVPGGDGSAGEAAALTAYLASPAGAYFSGSLFDLRGI